MFFLIRQRDIQFHSEWDLINKYARLWLDEKAGVANEGKQ
jgi:hypothetical protein